MRFAVMGGLANAGEHRDGQATPTTSDDGAASDRYVITVVGQLLPYYRTKLFIRSGNGETRRDRWIRSQTDIR